MCSITTKRYIFNFELNRRVPNGMHGGVRGRSKSALLDFLKRETQIGLFDLFGTQINKMAYSRFRIFM